MALLRRLLRSQEHFVTFREELDSIDEYLDIELVRFGSRLKLTKEIAPETLDDAPLGAARAQLHETYIIAQTRDGLVIVDQHAAHERLVYERMKESLEKSGVARQILLIPEIVELDDADVERLAARAGELTRFGLVIEAFGPGAVAVRETPSILGEIDARALLRDLAEHMAEWDETLPLQRRLMHVAATICLGPDAARRRADAAQYKRVRQDHHGGEPRSCLVVSSAVSRR